MGPGGCGRRLSAIEASEEYMSEEKAGTAMSRTVTRMRITTRSSVRVNAARGRRGG
jgi:hypothetical protein